MFEIVFLLRTSVFTFLQGKKKKKFPCIYIKSYLFKKIDFPSSPGSLWDFTSFFSVSGENKFALTGDFRLVIHHRALLRLLFFVRLTLFCFCFFLQGCNKEAFFFFHPNSPRGCGWCIQRHNLFISFQLKSHLH